MWNEVAIGKTSDDAWQLMICLLPANMGKASCRVVSEDGMMLPRRKRRHMASMAIGSVHASKFNNVTIVHGLGLFYTCARHT